MPSLGGPMAAATPHSPSQGTWEGLTRRQEGPCCHTQTGSQLSLLPLAHTHPRPPQCRALHLLLVRPTTSTFLEQSEIQRQCESRHV